MWRNYLTVGLRALAKNKTYAFINIVGLAIGLAACLMILLYVRYERSYDAWLPNAENVYQVQNSWQNPDTGEVDDNQMSAFAAGEALKKDYPQIAGHVYLLGASPVVMIDGEALAVENAVLASDRLFDVLQLPLVSGDPAAALARPGSVVINETQARRFFGEQDPVGRTLTIVLRGESIDHRVTGVIRDLPRNSHLRLNMAIRFDPTSYFAENPSFLTQWGNLGGWNYVALRPGTDVEAIRADLPQWERRNIPDQTFGDQTLNQGDIADWHLVNVRDVHLGAAQGGAMAPGNDERSIVTFAIIAVLILGMACVNFTNLATARASQRAREVALRKVLGATRKQLMTQFLVESVLVAAVAMLLALALVELVLPLLSAFLDADLQMRYVGGGGMLLPIAVLVVLVGAAGGIYPAFYLSRFQPAQVLKANKSTAEPGGSGRLRNALVVAQFAVSIGLIVCTAVVYGQTVHARTVDPGYQREGLIQIGGLNRRQVAPVSEALAREVARLDGVTSVGRTGLGIATGNISVLGVQVPGRTEPVGMHGYAIDDGFMPTMGMELIAGRLLDKSRPADDATLPFPADLEAERALVARGVNVVLNELGVRRLGYQNPAEAVGKTYRMFMVSPEAGGVVPITIVGVVKDARLRSVREPLDPIAYRLSDLGMSHMVVRYDTADPAALRERIGQVWKRFAADAPFEAEFSEEIVAELYDAEEARAKTFAGFALLAVIVACLGLFGLAAFTAERRTKEIGIRKVLGARSRDIVRLLAWQFSKPVVIANLIAWPVAWWLMRDWLNTFDARIDLGPGPFVMAGLLALAIAVGTIAGHALKVARSNPIHALRYE
ncbi:MAG: FtsX-like permease family protein [Allosphingosinicella sp.]|uniref:FtsX-like permease family protein n=1 Tax=Allosphingosinicella sp. TaxID=2823234 RepID=UPI0039284A1A